MSGAIATLHCPRCRGPLDPREEGYACRGCAASYPLRDGIIRMVTGLDRDQIQVRDAFDFEHRRFELARYLRITPQLIGDWLADVRMPREHFRGLTVLDAGCGTGRWTYAMASLGARVVAVDVSDAAVDQTRKITRDVGEVEVVQASLLALPFEPAQFDFVVSWGVLHHTLDTHAAFRTIAPLVRPGGHLHVMVYERRNPIKVIGTELLRLVLRRLSPEARYRFCGRLVIKNRFLFNLVRGVIACVPATDLTPQLDAETAQFGLYDWYSPQFNHLHSIAEVRGWYEQQGFEDVTVTTPIKYHRPLDVLRFGECGGSISIRGRRRGAVKPSVMGRVA
jgi:2-polyprenyl-3-methyl-5-hydroxy-6-metoxy-1,4-benzoquinol methylase